MPLTQDSTFFDYNDYFVRFRALHTREFFSAAVYPFTYFAPGVVLYRAFYVFGRRTRLGVFLLLSVCAVFLGAALLQRRISIFVTKDRATVFVGIATVCSYPILFCLERGNLEMVLAIGITIGVWAYATGRSTLAAVLWGVFGSVKLYPLLLVALFLSRRNFGRLPSWGSLHSQRRSCRSGIRVPQSA